MYVAGRQRSEKYRKINEPSVSKNIRNRRINLGRKLEIRGTVRLS